jgi:hypothetical protein
LNIRLSFSKPEALPSKLLQRWRRNSNGKTQVFRVSKLDESNDNTHPLPLTDNEYLIWRPTAVKLQEHFIEFYKNMIEISKGICVFSGTRKPIKSPLTIGATSIYAGTDGGNRNRK